MSAVSRIVRKSQATLFWCMQGLPKPKREAIYTLYAFVRHLDYIVGSSLPQNEKENLLQAWTLELNNIYDVKVPQTDIGRQIYKNCMRFKIQKKDFSAILTSTMLDFPIPLQAPLQKIFDSYCEGSSVAPIYIMLLIMGELKEASMRALSENLGKAIELTNILRNIKDDALGGHLYIPKEILETAGIYDTDPMSVVTNKNLIFAREKLAFEASKCFDKAHKLIFSSDKRSTRILRFIFHTYKRYFDIMFFRGWEIMSPKPQIKPWDKIKIAFNAIFDRY